MRKSESRKTGLTRRLAPMVAMSMALSATLSAQSSACDLDASGATNVVDVNRAVNMVLGVTPCTASVEGPQQCSIVTVQRVVNAALGQACVTYGTTVHSVVLTWSASASAGVVGYNVYRRTSLTGTFVKINIAPVNATTFTDTNVVKNQTYYYVATAADSTGQESGYSPQTVAVIPSL